MRATLINFAFFLSLNGFVLLPLHIQELGGTEIEIGIIMGVYSGVGIFCQPLIGPWVDAIGRRLFMIVGTALVVLAAVLPALIDAIPCATDRAPTGSRRRWLRHQAR